jgi:predicted nucleic acid-binding protein
VKTFFDSSAFAKRYIDEPGSQNVDDLCAHASDLGLSIVCVPEVISALNRRLRERSLTQREYARARRGLLRDVSDAEVISLTPAVIASVVTVLEESPLRAMDAIHVACALEWEAELFVTSDERQVKAASRARLRTSLV